MKKLRFYSVAKAVLGPIIKLFMRIRVHGKENEYSGDRGIVICSNHLSMLDCLTLAIALKRPIRFLAKKELFSIPVFRSLISSLGAYGVDRKSADVGAIKKTISMLREGASVGIFPQGTRCPKMPICDTKFKSGAVMAASHAKVPIQPVFIGTKNGKYRFLRRKEVYIGAVLTPEALGLATEERPDYSSATDTLKASIIALESVYLHEVSK